MPWCRFCRCEFVDGVARCSDCGAPLVGWEPPSAKEEKREKLVQSGGEPYFRLIQVDTYEQAALAEELLSVAGAPVWVLPLRRKPHEVAPPGFEIRTTERWLFDAEAVLRQSTLAGFLPEQAPWKPEPESDTPAPYTTVRQRWNIFRYELKFLDRSIRQYTRIFALVIIAIYFLFALVKSIIG